MPKKRIMNQHTMKGSSMKSPTDLSIQNMTVSATAHQKSSQH